MSYSLKTTGYSKKAQELWFVATKIWSWYNDPRPHEYDPVLVTESENE